MPTLNQVRNAVDNRLAALWTDQIVPRQDAFFATHGRYWQGIITTDVLNLTDNLSGGDPTVLEMTPTITGHPTDQPETWEDVGIVLGATIPMALEIHTYDGPQGKGYVGIVWAKWNGTVYRRDKNFGPETWRSEDWRIAPTGGIS